MPKLLNSSSRPGSPEASSARQSPAPFKVGGSKQNYDDLFLQLKEEEMLAIIRPNSTGHATVRERIRKGELEEGKEVFEGKNEIKIEAWDESEKLEAERIIQGLRANLKEVKETADVLKIKQDQLLTENSVMTELLVERKRMAEESLAVAAKVQKEYDALLYKLSMPPNEQTDLLRPEDGVEGFSSWRRDRARLGRKLEETEARLAQFVSERQQAEERARNQSLSLSEGERENMALIQEQDSTIAALKEQLSVALSDVAKERSAREEIASKLSDSLKVAEYASLLEQTNRDLNAQLESEKETNLSNQQRMRDLESGLLNNSQTGEVNDSHFQTLYNKEVQKNIEISERYKGKDMEIINQARTIVANANHIEKLETALEEKNGINAELIEVNRFLGEQATSMQADLQGKIALIEEQHVELGRLRQTALAEGAAHAAQLAERSATMESMQKDLEAKRERISSLQKDMSTAAETHNASFAHMTRLCDELQAKLEASQEELNSKKAALIDWEKKMSLFEIMQELETASKLRENELLARLAAAEGLRLQDLREKRTLEYNWRHTEDRLLMQHADDFYLRLLEQERAQTRRLRFDLHLAKENESFLHAEMRAINEARELEQLDFEKRQKLALNNVSKELRTTISQKTVEVSLLNSLMAGLKADADTQERLARETVAARERDIAERNDMIQKLKQDIIDMERLLFNKETELVRALAENKDFRLLESHRANNLAESINTAVVVAQRSLVSESNARAPRLRIAQLSELVRALECKAQQWERVAQEYMWEAQKKFQASNDDGYPVQLSIIDGSVHGIGAISVLEHTLANIAHKLVQTVTVEDATLQQLRKWIIDNNMSEEMEGRALRSVLLSWPGLEALAGLRKVAKEYGTLQLQDIEGITAKSTEMSDHRVVGSRQKGSLFLEDLEQRLFTLFEMGHVTVSEFRIMRELQQSLDLTVAEIADMLDGLNLPLSVCVDRALQDLSDRFEFKIAKDTSYELGIICSSLSAPGVACDREFIKTLQSLRKNIEKAAALRYEYMLLRSSYNQACTQMALWQDQEKLSARDRSSARGTRRSPRLEVHFSATASDLPSEPRKSTELQQNGQTEPQNQITQHHHHHHSEHESHGSLANVRQTLKKEVLEERQRRFDENRQRGMDSSAVSTLDSRAARLIQRAEHNLQCLELELAEGGSEIDKSRLVFIKLLRMRLSSEAAAKEETAIAARRVKEKETDAEHVLMHLEEALAALDIAELNKTTDVASYVTVMITTQVNDLRSRMRECNDSIEAALELVLKSREVEVDKNNRLYRVLEKYVWEAQSDKSVRSQRTDSLALPLNRVVPTEGEVSERIIADTQLHIQEVRRKDAALERLHYLLHTFAGNIIDKKYKGQLQDLQALLSNLQVVDENGLGGGGESTLCARVRWNDARVPSVSTRVEVEKTVDSGAAEGVDHEAEDLQAEPLPQTEEDDFSSESAQRLSPREEWAGREEDRPAAQKALKAPSGPSPLQALSQQTKVQLGAKLAGGLKGPWSENAGLPSSQAPTAPLSKPNTDLGYQQSLDSRSPKKEIPEETKPLPPAPAANVEEVKIDQAAANLKAEEEAQHRLQLVHEMRTMRQDFLSHLQDLKEKPQPKGSDCNIS